MGVTLVWREAQNATAVASLSFVNTMKKQLKKKSKKEK
jgi:hypothetical protein